ncbi:MAG: hypothetical protein HS114_01405 [Anaerolineales bacterium]|nr:hypothetical protein [Anaerolineales bacterium]
MAAIADDLLNLLRQHVLVQNVRVVNYDETPLGKLELKIRCRLAKIINFKSGYIMRPHFKTMLISCSPTTLFCDGTTPPLPPNLNRPHHFHDEIGQVGDSPLSGKPLEDLKIVLAEIEKWLASTKAA